MAHRTYKHVWYRSLLAPIGATAVLLGMPLTVELLLGGITLPPDGFSARVPVGAGRVFGVTLWTHELAFSRAYTTGGMTRQDAGPLRLTVWYRRAPLSRLENLVVVRIPAWPAAIVPAMVVSAGIWWWRGSINGFGRERRLEARGVRR